MQTMPFDPRSFLPLMRPVARITYPGVSPADLLAITMASRRRAREDMIRCAGLTQSYSELFFQNNADHTAYASSNSEATLLAGTNKQPVIPAFQLGNPTSPFCKGFSFQAAGILSTTSTPTITFQVRLGSTQGTSNLSGTSVGVSAAITTQSGVSNKEWELWLHFQVNTFGNGSNNTTLSCYGWVESPAGFASPFKYALQPTSPESATWTATVDGGVTQYLNLSATWGTSSSSNTATCKSCRAFAWN